MRMIPTPPEAENEDWFNAHAQMADWKESPSAVLDSVDHLLERYGLEVVQFETGDDSFQWQIMPRSAPAESSDPFGGGAPLGSLDAYATAYARKYREAGHLDAHLAGLRAVGLLVLAARPEAPSDAEGPAGGPRA